MPRDHKWIRSIKDNPAGKVVADPEGNRWEWAPSEQDETSRMLDKLNNDELAIEQTDLFERPPGSRDAADPEAPKRPTAPPLKKPATKPRTRDAGGGFNPYDSSGKTRKR